MKYLLCIAAACCVMSIATAQTAGLLDSAFSQNGLAIYNPTPGVSFTVAAMQADGKIVLAGSAVPSQSVLVLTRINPDSTLDSSFGVNGYVIDSSFYNASFETSLPVALEVGDDNKLYVAVHLVSSGFSLDAALIRFAPDGMLDNDFGTGGILYTTSDSEHGSGLVKLNDGSMVFYYDQSSNFVVEMMGLTATGDLNNAFGSGGVAVLPGADYSLSGGLWMSPRGVKLPNGGYALLVAKFSTQEKFIVGFNGAGSVDTTFGDNGWVLDSDSIWTIYHGIFTDASSNLYLLTTPEDAMATFYIHKYNSGGQPDASFGNSGSVTFPIHLDPTALAVTNSGKIVVAGYTNDAASEANAFVARFNADGTPDSTFASFGYNFLELNGYNTFYSRVILDEDLIYCIGGMNTNPGNGSGLVARYANNELTGIESNVIRNAEISVYPNPSSDRFVVIVLKPTQRARLVVANAIGQVMFEKDLTQDTGNEFVIPATNWPNGVYVVSLRGGDVNANTRFIKQ